MEWTVFQVVAALAALFLSLGVPIIQLNGTITRLNVTLERTEKDVLQQKKELERQKEAAGTATAACGPTAKSRTRRCRTMTGASPCWKRGGNHEHQLDRAAEEQGLLAGADPVAFCCWCSSWQRCAASRWT